jgi:hypothetical protein
VDKKEKFHQAKIRAKAKAFRNSIPAGMAIKLPDQLLDNLADKDLPVFFDALNRLGVHKQNGTNYWENK